MYSKLLLIGLSTFWSWFLYAQTEEIELFIETDEEAEAEYDRLNQPNEPALISYIDKMPMFPSSDCWSMSSEDKQKACCDKSFLTFIYENLCYPETARRAGIEGTAYCQFTVDVRGRIGEIRVLRDPGGGCGQEAVRVLNEMKGLPPWRPYRPGRTGVVTPIRMNVPIRFKLQ